MTPQDIFYIVGSITMILGIGLGTGLTIIAIKMMNILTEVVVSIENKIEHVAEQKSPIAPMIIPIIFSVIKHFIRERR